MNINKDKITAHFGADFYDKVISDLKRYETLWGLSEYEQIDYYSVNCIFSCKSHEFSECILKIGRPCRETQTEYDMLKEYESKRFCKAYRVDIDNGILLIQRIIPGKQLRAEQDLDKRLDGFCQVWTGLHKPPINKQSYPTYLGWVTRIAKYMSTREDYPCLAKHMDKASKLCQSMVQRYNGKLLLHGDLHHDNILLGSDGYYVIDPKGVVGDRVFDIPRFILNEFGDGINDEFVKRYHYIVAYISKRLAIPQNDINRLMYIETCMANSWNVEDNSLPNMDQVEFVSSLPID